MSAAQRDAIGRAMRPLEQPHEILGVPRGADEAVLRKSYRMMCKILHPDKCDLEEAKGAFQRVGAAFEALLAGPATTSSSTSASTSAVPPAKPAAAAAAPAPAKAPKFTKGERNFTVRVAPAPTAQTFRAANASKPAAKPIPAPVPKPAATQESEDEDEESSDEDEDENEDEGVSFAAIGASAGYADDDLNSDDDLVEDQPLTSRPSAHGKSKSKGGGGQRRKGTSKGKGAKRARKRRARDEDDDFIVADDGDGCLEARLEGEDGERRSGRNAKRRRVDYGMLEEHGVRAEQRLGGDDDDDDDDDDEAPRALNMWVPPLWFEYQSDSEDDDEEAERKRHLKARVLAAKRQAAAEGGAERDRTVPPPPKATPRKAAVPRSALELPPPAAAEEVAEEGEEEGPFVGCFCGSEHEPEWWAQCAECERWCHGECTGHSKATIEQVTYLCSPCAAADAAALGALDDEDEMALPPAPPSAPTPAEQSSSLAPPVIDDDEDGLLDLLGD